MNKVADKAGITAPTLYHYFGGKTELLEEANRLLQAEIEKPFDMVFPKSVPAEMKILMNMSQVVDYFQKNNIKAGYLIENPVDRPIDLGIMRHRLISLFRDHMGGCSFNKATAATYDFLGLVVGGMIYYRSKKKELPDNFVEVVLKKIGKPKK